MASVDQHATPPSRAKRLYGFLNDPVNPFWERPTPTPAQRSHDVVGMLMALLVGLAMVVLAKSIGRVVEGENPWRAYLAVALMVAPLAIRRVYPLVTLIVSSVLFLTLTYLSPEASISVTFQVAYFTAIYSAVAWARNRRALWFLCVLVLCEMTLWLTTAFTLTNALSSQSFLAHASGPLPPQLAAVLFTAAMNGAYFGGALLIGRTSWRGALQRQRADDRAAQLEAQSAELARRAVLDERIRIARELHDVVAHHISVIGIQAGAARRVLDVSPRKSEEALRTVETASRDAVTEMRSLLQILRHEPASSSNRAPEPTLADLDALAEWQQHAGLGVRIHRTEDFLAVSQEIPGPVALSAYRCIQEALTNVVRHSTATTAQVTLRSGRGGLGPWLELEVVDGGRPRPNTNGTGYGIQGIQERAELHRGAVDCGPREHESGWRVRVRLPLPE